MVNDTTVCNSVDDTTLYATDDYLPKVFERLEKDSVILSNFFQENFMKLNKR